MKRTIQVICFAALLLPISAKDSAPKWGFLGDDPDLLRIIKDSDEAVLAYIYRVEFLDIKGSFATVNLYATVARTFKGNLKPDDRIVIEFPIDNAPTEIVEHDKRRDSDIGNLRFCFIQRPTGAGTHYESDGFRVPKFTQQMNDFLEAYRRRRNSK